MLKTTEAFIEELEERDWEYEPVKTIEDGDEMVRLGIRLKSTAVRFMIFFDADEQGMSLRCFDLVIFSDDQFEKALNICNEMNNKMRWTKFCIHENSIAVEIDAMVDEDTAGKITTKLMGQMAAIIDEAYPLINKAIWA